MEQAYQHCRTVGCSKRVVDTLLVHYMKMTWLLLMELMLASEAEWLGKSNLWVHREETVRFVTALPWLPDIASCPSVVCSLESNLNAVAKVGLAKTDSDSRNASWCNTFWSRSWPTVEALMKRLLELGKGVVLVEDTAQISDDANGQKIRTLVVDLGCSSSLDFWKCQTLKYYEPM